MVSPLARYMLVMLAGIVVVGAVPDTGFPQSPVERLRADDDSKRITDEISAVQATGGPRSPDLIDPLTELAGLFEAQGDHALAVAALEEARQVVRITYGLHTLDQAPLIEQALENQRALGAFAMVRALEEKLFDLAARHPDDLRTVAIHRNFGERRMDLLRRFLLYEYPAEIYPEAGLFGLSRDAEIMDLLSEAQIHYADAVAVVLRNRIYSSDQLRDLEMEIVGAADLVRQRNRLDTRSTAPGARRLDHVGIGGGYKYAVGRRIRGGEYISTAEELRTRTNTLWDLAASESPEEAMQRRYRADRIDSQYAFARESYRRVIDYAETVTETAPADGPAWRSQLEAYLQLADWDLVHSANGIALGEYEQVHKMLAATEGAEPLIAEMFAPSIPVVLPTFRPNPLKTQTSTRHIDVTFEITKYGESRRIEIVAAAPSVSDADRDDLVSLLMTSRFRPRVVDGELGRASPVAVRYYLND